MTNNKNFDLFSYNDVPSSKDFPTILHSKDAEPTNRQVFWNRVIKQELSQIPESGGEKPVYIATGGGYSSFDGLLDYFKQHHPQNVKLPNSIPAISGEKFYNLPELSEEKEAVKKAIIEFLIKKEHREVLPDDAKAQAMLRSFYSHEFNTTLSKEIVMEAIKEHKSVAHVSASIYNDTELRASLADTYGVSSILVAGDNNLDTAIRAQSEKTTSLDTAVSHKKFSERFQNDWINKFDQIYLYNTDEKEPILIAQKTGRDNKLEILDAEKYNAFIAKKDLDTEKYRDGVQTVVGLGHEGIGPAVDKPEYKTTPQTAGGFGEETPDNQRMQSISWEEKARNSRGSNFRA